MADLYSVDRIRPVRRMLERGELKAYYRIEATTKGGVSFDVEVPEEDMTKEKVAQILSEKATELDAILQL